MRHDSELLHPGFENLVPPVEIEGWPRTNTEEHRTQSVFIGVLLWPNSLKSVIAEKCRACICLPLMPELKPFKHCSQCPI
jgi:hypothetical protein